MPFYSAPSNDIQRLTFLTRTAETGPDDIAAGNAYVSQETLDAVAALVPQFEVAARGVSAKLGARSKEVRERAVAIEQVKMYTRDMWEVIKRRARRLNQPAGVLQFYQLPISGVLPKLTTQGDWLAMANRVVQGDADAVAAGYPPALDPSAADLAAVLKATKSEVKDVAMADRAYDKAQEAVAVLRPQVDELIADVIAELRFTLRKKDAPSQRRMMRTYGARFRYLAGEPVDPDDVVEGEEESGTPKQTGDIGFGT